MATDLLDNPAQKALFDDDPGGQINPKSRSPKWNKLNARTEPFRVRPKTRTQHGELWVFGRNQMFVIDPEEADKLISLWEASFNKVARRAKVDEREPDSILMTDIVTG